MMMDIDELTISIAHIISKGLDHDLRKSLTMEEALKNTKSLIEQHDEKLIKGYINLLPEIQRRQANLASEIVKGRYGLQGIYEDFPEGSKERVEAERDYWESVVQSILKKAWEIINENKKMIIQVEDNSKENL